MTNLPPETLRTYSHKTFSPKVQAFQAQLRASQKEYSLTLAQQHKDILCDALLCYFHTLESANDILLQTHGATSSLARFTLYYLLRDFGHTLQAIACATNRSPTTVLQGIETLEKTIIDKPNDQTYSNSYMQRHAELPKSALLHAIRVLKNFNEELTKEDLTHAPDQAPNLSLQSCSSDTKSEQQPDEP